MPARIFKSRILHVEALEPRFALSLTFGTELAGDDVAAEGRDPAKGGGSGPPIRLDVVALHEFGHSLGLQHSSDPNSIMYAYYNANYNLANFANDSAVATFQALYANVDTSPWKDDLDPEGNDGHVEVTYSFMPDGARMDQGSNTLFSTFNKLFGSESVWRPIFAGELNLWASVSNGHVSFVEHSDAGRPFNYAGAAQNDPYSGDIRIGAHRFDSAGKVLAHTYFPPPNAATAAGDSHYDQAENWVLSAASSSAVMTGGGAGGGISGALVLAPPGDESLPASVDVQVSRLDHPDAGPTGSQVSVISDTRTLQNTQLRLRLTPAIASPPAWPAAVATTDEFRSGRTQGSDESQTAGLDSLDLLETSWLDTLAIDLAQSSPGMLV
jgi:hypothetical protein